VELAERVDLSVRSITAYESGETTPLTEHVEALARALRFPVSFFEQPEFAAPEPDVASFRSMKKMTAAQRDMALASGALCIELSRWIEQRFDLVNPDLPDLRGTEPEAAAAEVREAWKLGSKPIKSIVHQLEARGVRVFSLAHDSVEVDAFSLWQGKAPFIFLNTLKSGERGRFDAAHELGHLVLHRHGAPQGRDAEQQADDFASALLMPRETVIASAPRVPSVENLIALKRMWGVSVIALVVRLHRLGLLTDWNYRQLCCDLSVRGYRKKEPDPMPRETSQVLDKVFAALREDGLGKADVAQALHIHAVDLEEFVFGLVAVPTGRPALRRPLRLA
jgi:Zn-dependent peptidase ImmA (M78 family)